MKKYAIPGAMLIAGHEVISILALVVAMFMFLSDIFKTAEKEGRSF